jgi:hypothetical protein
VVVGAAAEEPDERPARDPIQRMIDDVERLRGLRISIRRTDDGLGIYIPPSRSLFAVAFMCVWLCAWGVGEWFALSQLLSGPLWGPDLFLLVWIIPWTIGGGAVLWATLWQVFGVERLFFTAGALVREWSVLGLGGRRVVNGTDIIEVRVDNSKGNDLAGFGTIKVKTKGRAMWIGSGLDSYGADLVAAIIRDAAAGETSAPDAA